MALRGLFQIKLRTLLLFFLTSVILTYISGHLDLIFLYISLFSTSALFFYWMIFLLITNLIWTLIYPSSRKSDPQPKSRFQILILLLILIISAAIYSIKILKIQTHVRIIQPSIENFHAHPYANWVPARNNSKKSGVTFFRPEMCSPGLNLYAQRDYGEAYLADMEGNIVHTWTYKTQNLEDWSPIEMRRNGDLLALMGNIQILKLDRDSNILWNKKSRFHHELFMDENGNIWTLINNDRIVNFSFVPLSVLDNTIVALSPDGKIIKEIPLYSIFKDMIPMKAYGHVLFHIPLRYPGMIRSWLTKGFFFNTDMKLDILHTNSVTILDRAIEGLCEKGDILISVRELDTIAILSRQTEKIIWEWGSGEIDKQHHATLLDNGNILLFDNGPSRGFSRVIEVNPLSRKIEWEYKAHPPKAFFSSTRGSCQRLPTGNTLITESNNGRVFEVTKDGETVWEFFTPTVSRKDGVMRSTIYRMTRIPDTESFF